MTGRGLCSFVGTPLAVAVALALALATVVTSGENIPNLRPTVLVGDDLLRVFQEGKDAAEQVDPPEISLGPAFDPHQDYQ